MAHDDLPVARAAPELSEEDAKAVKSALRWSRLSVGVLVGTTIFQVATGSGFGALLSAILLVMTLCCGVRGLRQGNGTKVLWHARAHACCACLIVVFVIPAIFISLAAYNCACSVECREMFLPNPADFAPASNASGLAPADHNRSSDAPPSGFKSNLSPMESHRGPPPASGPHADGEQPADREKPADGEQIEGEGSGVAASRRLSAASSNAEAHRGKHHHDRRFASRAERRAAKAAHKAARRAARRAAANGEAPEAGEGPHGPEDPHSRRHGKAHAIAQAVFKTFMGHIGGTRDTPAGRAGPHHRDQARPQHEDHHHGEGRPHAKDRQHEDPEEAIDESPAHDGRPGDMKMDDALPNDAAAPAVQPRLGAHARRMQADSNRVAGPPRPKGGAHHHGSSRAESHHDSSGWHSAWHSHSHDDEDEAAFSWHSGGDSGKHGKRPHGGFGGRWGPDGGLDEDLSREDVAAFVAEATEQLDMMCTVSNGMSGPAVFLAVVVSTLLAGMHFKTSRAGFAAAAKLPSGRGCGGPFRGGMLHTTAGLTPARLQGGNASTAPAPQAPAQRAAGPGAHAAAAGDDYPFSAPVAAPPTGSFMSRIRGMVAQQRGYATVETFDDAPPRAAPVGAGSAAVAPPQQAATAPPPVSYEEYLRLVAASS